MQHSALLSVIGAIESSSLQVIKFNTVDVKPHLPYHVAFEINVIYSKYVIIRIVVDEGSSSCVMSLSC